MERRHLYLDSRRPITHVTTSRSRSEAKPFRVRTFNNYLMHKEAENKDYLRFKFVAIHDLLV